MYTSTEAKHEVSKLPLALKFPAMLPCLECGVSGDLAENALMVHLLTAMPTMHQVSNSSFLAMCSVCHSSTVFFYYLMLICKLSHFNTVCLKMKGNTMNDSHSTACTAVWGMQGKPFVVGYS